MSDASDSGGGRIPRGRLAEGATLNDTYRVRRLIARGAHSEVYEAENLQTGQRVAVKLLAAGADDAAAFSEARKLARIEDDAVARVFAAARDLALGVTYLAMEYIDGPSLASMMGRESLPTPELLALARRLAGGLAAAHRTGVTHLNLSPDDVLLPGGELRRAKIVGFGAGEALPASGTAVRAGFARNLDYVAAEQLGDDGEVGPWTDVCGLGLTLLPLANRASLGSRVSLAGTLERRRFGVDLSRVPVGLRPLFERMVAANPAERFQSMDELRQALSPAFAAPVAAPPPAASAPSRSPFAPPRSDAQPGGLAWLQQRRLEAVLSGAAPFPRVASGDAMASSSSPADALHEEAPWTFTPSPSARARLPEAPINSPSAPSTGPARPAAASGRSRGSRATLWGGAALGGAAAVGVLVLATAQLGDQLNTSLQRVGPAVGDSTAAASNSMPAPGDRLQALAGSWTPRPGVCDRTLHLAVANGRLVIRRPGSASETADIESAGPDGGVVVKAAGGAATYRADADTLVVTDGRGRATTYVRCASPGASNAAANVAGEATLIAMAMAGASGPAPEPPPIRDEVDVSAFAPKQLRAGDAALVQIYLHLIEQAETVAERARAADPQAAPRGQTTLGLELARGVRVDIMLDAGGLGLEEPIQSVIWRGHPCAAQFAVQASADAKLGQRVLTARVLVDGVPLGRLAFTLTVAPAEAAAAAHVELTGDFARRYARAFLSYSSLDRPEVLKTAQTLRATGIDYFQDILSIEPGAEWRARLFAEIDRCDLFLLFWSSHAAGSDWVRQEAEYALARRHGSTEATPDIRPIILEGPPVPPPPASLAELHFNDMLRYVVVASELEARARRAPDA